MATLESKRTVEFVGAKGISGVANSLRPDRYVQNLLRDVENLGGWVNMMEAGETWTPGYHKMGEHWAADGHMNILLDYIGVRGDLSMIMGNVVEANREINALVEKYIPEELRENFSAYRMQEGGNQ